MKSSTTQPLLAVLCRIVTGVAALSQDASVSVNWAPEITAKGAPGTTQSLEMRDALEASNVWRPLTNFVIGATPVGVLDLTVPPEGKRFYRVVTSIGPPNFQDPSLSISLVPTLTVNGTEGARAQIEWADALGDTNQWRTLNTVTFGAAPKVVVDRGVPLGGKRVYRTVSLPAEPAGRPLGFVWISGGIFMIGTPASEVGRGWEGPQTVVTLSKSFWIGQYEVTQKEYEGVQGAHKSSWTGDNLPVEMVTWQDAVDYCSKLTELERNAGRLPTGYIYRLPTEAEWEYACRAGTTTRFSHGDDPGYEQLGDYAWFTGNAQVQTHPVGTRLPNPWGLYDVHGNVWEWCQDWYGPFPGGNATDPQNVEPSFVGLYRTVRGGCLANVGSGCRSANRNGFPPNLPYFGIGFRVVLAPAL